MTLDERLELHKAYKQYSYDIATTKRMAIHAERYRFLHPDDVAGYAQRVAKVRRYEYAAPRKFNTMAKAIVSSRIRVLWEHSRCCLVLHKQRGIAMPDVLVLGTPTNTDGYAMMMLRHEAKVKAEAKTRNKLKDLDIKRMALVKEINLLQVRYQSNQHEVLVRRTRMSQHPSSKGIAGLNDEDKALHAEITQYRHQLHLDYVAIPRRQARLVKLDAKRTALRRKLGVSK